MSNYLISGETMTNLADSVRTLSGETGEMTPDEIINTVNNTKSAIDSLNEHIDDKNNPHNVTAKQIGAFIVKELTKAEYDALEEKDPNILYIITDLNQPGGNVSGDAVYISADEPVDPNIRVWIDTDEEGGGGNSDDVKVKIDVYEVVIGTTWTENSDTGVKSQNIDIEGVTADHTAKVDHAYTGDGTSESYAIFVEEENQFLTYITNGYAETYDGGIKFTIFGDPNTVEIPIVVEVV